MNDNMPGNNTLIAAERRRRIYDWALQQGSVNVTTLAEALGVRPATIRNDLDVLDREGKLIRSHGGAIIKDDSEPRPPYSQTRNEHIPEKSRIGAAALSFLPDSGSVFIGSGTTTSQLAMRVPDNPRLHVVTNAPEIALHLSTNGSVAVDLLGGRMRSESLSTSCLSDAAMDMLYWDVTFVGLTAVDLVRGISTIDQDGALCLKKIMEHGSKTVALCDSSKLGRFSYARIGAIDLIDVLITDSLVSPEVLEGFAAHGVEIVVAGPLENGNGAESPGGNGHHPG